MRVVAGTARGRRISAPPGDAVRPTGDRVREAVFNALGSLAAVDGARVLDLFAGSGALAIEALSRGAASAVLVDRDPSARRTIEANLAVTGLAGRATVVGGSAEAFLSSCTERFDLVLLDPPYRFDRWPALLDALAPHLDGVAVIESDRPIETPPGWRVERQKRYGGTIVAIARPHAANPSAPQATIPSEQP
jgi:16S rRNA (guanine966-N2)-methyltransferase